MRNKHINGGGADLVEAAGSKVPSKPKYMVLGYDRPMFFAKFILFKVLTLKFLLPIYININKNIKMLLEFDNDKTQHFKSLKELNEMNNSNFSIDSNDFGYTGDVFSRELDFIHKYAVQTKNFSLLNNKSESKELYERVIADLSRILSEGRIQNVFNFGIGYAFIDKQLAIKFPNINFFGIERSPAAKFYNDHDGVPANLKILQGDVILHLENNKYANGLFVHIRTAVLLPKTFIHNLYSKLEISGFVELYAVEQLGLSRRSGTNFGFSFADKESELYRRHMFIHNYPGILNMYKFNIKTLELFQTNHPHFDYRMLIVGAQKNLL
jgi:hypothetical protein